MSRGAAAIGKAWAAAATVLAAVALIAVSAPTASAKSCSSSASSGGSYGITLKVTGTSCGVARQVFKKTKCQKSGTCRTLKGWTCTPKIADGSVKSIACTHGAASVRWQNLF